jgi:hypothetical protein
LRRSLTICARPGKEKVRCSASGRKRADAEAHDIAVALDSTIVVHPLEIDTHHAFKTASEMRAPKPYLARNKDIVRETSLLIAAPAGSIEQLRVWDVVDGALCAPGRSPGVCNLAEWRCEKGLSFGATTISGHSRKPHSARFVRSRAAAPALAARSSSLD